MRIRFRLVLESGGQCKMLFQELTGNKQDRLAQITTAIMLNSMGGGARFCLVARKHISHEERSIIKSNGIVLASKIGIIPNDGDVVWLFGSENRSKLKRRQRAEIVQEILSLLCDHPCRITEIVRKCNLNYESALSMLERLKQRDMVRITEDGGVKRVNITEKGITTLNQMLSGGRFDFFG